MFSRALQDMDGFQRMHVAARSFNQLLKVLRFKYDDPASLCRHLFGHELDAATLEAIEQLPVKLLTLPHCNPAVRL